MATLRTVSLFSYALASPLLGLSVSRGPVYLETYPVWGRFVNKTFSTIFRNLDGFAGIIHTNVRIVCIMGAEREKPMTINEIISEREAGEFDAITKWDELVTVKSISWIGRTSYVKVFNHNTGADAEFRARYIKAKAGP